MGHSGTQEFFTREYKLTNILELRNLGTQERENFNTLKTGNLRAPERENLNYERRSSETRKFGTRGFGNAGRRGLRVWGRKTGFIARLSSVTVPGRYKAVVRQRR